LFFQHIAAKSKHGKLILPSKTSRISGEIEELSGWKVMVRPRDSSEIPKYIIDKWQP
jgi:acetyl-CoA decarbonylase/synthase complex subunit gamma